MEIFLQTRCIGTKDANYILAILDAREKFVAHERFQYVLLKKFGELKYLFVNLLKINVTICHKSNMIKKRITGSKN